MSSRLFEEEEHTRKYCQHRPGYPKQLFEEINNYYYFNGNPTNKNIPLALDVGCGSGQATIGLSSFCDRVIGIDVSTGQIAHAMHKDNIEYRCNEAEDLTFLEANSIDLITVATALHWFDIESFVKEVKHVLKSDIGVFAVWTYGSGTLDNPMANAVYQEFDQVILSPYWNDKCRLVDDYYQALLPLLPYKSTFREYQIEQTTETTIGQFLDLIQTFSACQTYRSQVGEKAYQDLLETLRKKFINCYTKNYNHEKADFNSIELSISNSIRLYLMRKNEKD